MNKKEYIRPELLTVPFTLREVILSSPEDLNSHIGDPGDWGDWGDDIEEDYYLP